MQDMTIGQAVARYIDSKTAVLSPSTIKGYRQIQKKHIAEIESVQLSEVTVEFLQKYINKLSYSYSPKTVRNIYGLLHITLRMFCPEMHYQISLPQKIKPSCYIPESTEIEHIYRLIKGNKLAIPFLLAVQCGLRPSEISALCRENITAYGLEIRRAIVLNENGKEVYKPPKSYSGYRTVPLSESLRCKLLQSKGNRICDLSPKEISREWHKFLIKNEISPFRFYSLRHYFASQSLLLGIPQKYIAEIMGHSTTDMLEQVYQHTFPSAMDKFKRQIAENSEKLYRL